jgi:Putative transposase/Transposase zinc-binding domain
VSPFVTPDRPRPRRPDWQTTRAEACAPLPTGYKPRDAEASPLHRAIRHHRASFTHAVRRRGQVVPRLVERELDGFLGCGVLARGFARVRCGACGHELLVPFSCKRRGICPSCTARRAENTAAHLVDHVLPRAPYRQWVFTFPIPVRLALSRRPHLLTAALQACMRVLFAWQRRRLRRRGLRHPATGAITFVQRFGSALQLNVHFHVLVPDGAFDGDGVFVAADAPDDDDVRTVLLRAGRRVTTLLSRFFSDDDDRRHEIDRLLQQLDASSATPQPSLFPRPQRRASLSAFVEGFSLHAATRVPASDRRGLWRLCAYGARGALALSRLSELPDGRFAWHMKRPLPDGRSRLVLTGVELIERLVPLIPPVYANLTRFHGVFAPTSRLRAKVVPRPEPPPPCSASSSPTPSTPAPTTPAPTPPSPAPPVRSTYRLDWAALLKRVFAVDVMVCSRCDGPMKVIAFLEEPSIVRGILEHLGLPAEPLPEAKAQASPATVELFEDP